MRVPVALVLLVVAAAASPGQLYATGFGRRVLSRADQIVVGKVVHVRTAFRGISSARLQVTEKLAGFDRAGELVLLYFEDFMAPDAFSATLERSTLAWERRGDRASPTGRGDPASERSTPTRVNRSVERARGGEPRRYEGVRLAKGEQGIFFLERKGASYGIVGLIPEHDVLYESKRARLREVLQIEAILEVDRRVANAKALFLGDLAAEDPWRRGNSARELRQLAERFPRTFDDAEVRSIVSRLFAEPEPPIRAALERAARALAPDRAVQYAPEAEEAERTRAAVQLKEEAQRLAALTSAPLLAADVVRVAQLYGRAATTILVPYLEHDDAIVRERTAQALGDHGGPSAREPLRRALTGEVNPEATAAILYACGIRADPAAVPLVEKRLRQADVRPVALHALARIGTPEARAALERYRGEADSDTRALIDGLLREEFAREG